MSDVLAQVDSVRDALVRAFGPEPPAWAVVLGSGFGSFTDALEDRESLPYTALGIPAPLVSGHAGQVVVGRAGGVRVACLSGRIHLYEGHPVDHVVLGLRALLRWGARHVALTASVGSIQPAWGAGSIVLLSDHISFLGQNPLRGINLDAFGPRFPDLSNAYTPRLRVQARALAARLGVPLEEGVYAAMPGPSFETPAEIRMLRIIGADVVGMSIVPETVVAAHAGVPVVAFGVVANLAAGLSDVPLDHDTLTRAVSSSVDALARLMLRLVAESR